MEAVEANADADTRQRQKVQQLNDQQRKNKICANEVQEQIAEHEEEMLLRSCNDCPVLPIRFDKPLSEVRRVGGGPMTLNKLKRENERGLLEYEDGLLTSNDTETALKIGKAQKEIMSYAKAYESILVINQKLQDLRTQQQAVELDVITFRLCKKDSAASPYELWNMNWNRYDTIGGRLLNKGDQLSITVTQPDKQIMCLGTVVDVTTKLAIRLMSTKALDVNDLVKWRDADETSSATIRFSDAANNDVLKDAEIYNHYNVWKFPSDARVVLSASNNWVATKRMIQAVQHVEQEITIGNEFYKLLLGYQDQGSMEQRIKVFSQNNLPQIDIESELQLLQTEVQDTFDKSMNPPQLTALRKALTSSLCLI